MSDARQKLEERLARGFKKRPEPPKLAVVAKTEFSADIERERARRAARLAAEAEQREIEAANERQQRLAVWEAVHYHAVEEKFHQQQAQQFREAYRGFHSKWD